MKWGHSKSRTSWSSSYSLIIEIFLARSVYWFSLFLLLFLKRDRQIQGAREVQRKKIWSFCLFCEKEREIRGPPVEGKRSCLRSAILSTGTASTFSFVGPQLNKSGNLLCYGLLCFFLSLYFFLFFLFFQMIVCKFSVVANGLQVLLKKFEI